jgi:hypothetical protein
VSDIIDTKTEVNIYFSAFLKQAEPKVLKVLPTKTIKEIKDEDLNGILVPSMMFLFVSKDSNEPLKDC